MKTKLTRIISILLTFLMLFGINASAADTGKIKTDLSQWLQKNISVPASDDKIDSYLDWTVFAMARNGYTLNSEAYGEYIKVALNKNMNSLYLNDYARIALAVMSIGMDPENIGGINLIEEIEKTDYSKEMYTGSIAYALIALNSANSKNEKSVTTLKKILIDAQRSDGGFNSYLIADPDAQWTLSGETDSTGIALQALGICKSEPDVKAVVDKAIQFIENEQMSTGCFGSWGSPSAESTSMILAGLCSVGEDPDKYIKNNNSVIDSMQSFVNEDGGGKCWDGSSNIMTSYQMLMGISAYERFKNGKVGLFDMSCLSPECNSIEHIELFEKIPFLGQLLCEIVSLLCGLLGIEYFCCKHSAH